MMDKPIGALLRFIAGFALECAMLAIIVWTEREISPFILALPFGLMGYDASTLIKNLPIGGKK